MREIWVKKKRPQNLWPWISSLISDFRYKYYQAERTFLPFALLAARTFLPPFVLILDLKPWTLALEIFLGWNVILLITVFLSANRDFRNYPALSGIRRAEHVWFGSWTFTSLQTCFLIIRVRLFDVKYIYLHNCTACYALTGSEKCARRRSFGEHRGVPAGTCAACSHFHCARWPGVVHINPGTCG